MVTFGQPNCLCLQPPMFTSRRKTLFSCVTCHWIPQRTRVSHKQIASRNKCLGKQANKMSDITITYRANGKIYIPPSFYPKDYLLYLMWTCLPVICRTGELQSFSDWLSLPSSPLKISIVTKYVQTAKASASTECCSYWSQLKVFRKGS